MRVRLLCSTGPGPAPCRDGPLELAPVIAARGPPGPRRVRSGPVAFSSMPPRRRRPATTSTGPSPADRPGPSVFGVSDGLVSNISLILGFAGSGVDSSVVRLAGLAGLLAGAISMGAGEWVSVTAQNELIGRELDVERRELARHPEAETAELTRLYVSRGVPAAPRGRRPRP